MFVSARVGFVVGAVTILGLFGCGLNESRDSSPVYTMEQTDSAHAHYRRTTLTSGETVYVHDYEESALIFAGASNEQVIGHTGGGIEGGEREDLVVIPGLDPKDYVGLVEPMQALGVFRNIQRPAFDWRTATFRQIRFPRTDGPAAQKESGDPLLIAEVVTALNEGKAAKPPSYVSGPFTNVYGLYLFSDQLAGLPYCAAVYLDPTGPVYLAVNVSEREWFPAGPLFSEWVTTPVRRVKPERK